MKKKRKGRVYNDMKQEKNLIEQERRVSILSRRMNSWCSQSVQRRRNVLWHLLLNEERVHRYIYIKEEKKKKIIANF